MLLKKDFNNKKTVKHKKALMTYFGLQKKKMCNESFILFYQENT